MLSGVIISALKGSRVWLQQGENVIKTGSFLFQLLCHPFHLFLAAPFKTNRRSCFQHGTLCRAANLSCSPSHCLASLKSSSINSVQFTCSVVSDSLRPHGPQHTRTPCPLSITSSWSLLKLMSIESVMPSNHLILCRPLLLLPSIFPNIRVFSNQSVLPISPLPSAYFKLPSQLCKHLPQATLSHHSSLVNQWFPSLAFLRVHLMPK